MLYMSVSNELTFILMRMVFLVMDWLHLPMQISTRLVYYQAKLQDRSDLMETSVINPFTETASRSP